MTKDKKNISDFQKALLSHSQFIGKDSPKPGQAKKKTTPKSAHQEYMVELQPEIFREMEKVAAGNKIDFHKFVNLALEHFLKIEYVSRGQ